MPYQYAPLTRKLMPTIKEATTAIRSADSTTAFDPRPLLAILTRLPQADTRIAGLIQTRTLAVTGYPFDIIPSDAENDRALEIAKLVKNRFMRSKLPYYFNHLLGAVFFGNSALNLQWQNIDAETIAQVKPIPSSELFFKENELWHILDELEFKTEQLIPEQHITLNYNPNISTSPNFIGGLLRSCLFLCIMKHYNWQDWAKFNEMFAQPTRWAQWKQGASDEDKSIAKTAAEQIGADAWAAVSEDVELKFIEAQRTGSIQAYKELLQSINDELSIIILGQTLTTELAGNAGSKAAAQVHNLVRNDLMWHDLQLIERTINEQYITVDYRLNHGDDITLMPQFKFVTSEQIDFESNARIVSELKNAGYILDDNEVSEKTGFSVTTNISEPTFE